MNIKEAKLVGLCTALGAERVGGPLSPDEAELMRCSRRVDRELVDAVRAAIGRGEDPLGEEFCVLRRPEQRRSTGAFYTDQGIVSSMLSWVLRRHPARLVDAGCGSGRFSIAARRRGFAGEILAVDRDPLSTLMTRAHLAAAGLAGRVIQADFLTLQLRRCLGRTAFIGNPPYVRHHQLDARTKSWAKRAGEQLGLGVSGLAGLHALFILAVAIKSRAGDLGCFITSAEWLDTCYGALLRKLLAGPLGVVRLDVLDPRAVAFEEAMTTAAITSWEVGYTRRVAVRRVDSPRQLGVLRAGVRLARQRLIEAERWSTIIEPTRSRDGLVPLGSFARVHRGVATGANDFFVMRREEAERRGLAQYVRPCLVRASQVIAAGGVVRAGDVKHVLVDVDEGEYTDAAVRRYLAEGERRGVPERYLCSHRRPWWRVGGPPPPPIVATYMARQPPVFAANPDRCQILNVFHGVHFLEPSVDSNMAAALVAWLNSHRDEWTGGRTYHGGLLKFEPRELEGLLVAPLRQFAEKGQV